MASSGDGVAAAGAVLADAGATWGDCGAANGVINSNMPAQHASTLIASPFGA
jgi:hypothetical protein